MCDFVSGPDFSTGNYSTLNNTPGIGDPVVPFSNTNVGSGDNFGGTVNNQKKKKKTTRNQNVLSDNIMTPRPYIVYQK